ncbi:MAG TPA: hypothetical protein VE986_07435 [Hyphomicrobiales bacterium]|nr:hypothetical protein [Hyphomicrobiales bacterium]
MSVRSVMILAGMLALADPPAGETGPQDDKVKVLRSLANRIGRVLGAASACPAIAQARIKSVAEKVSAVIINSAPSEEEGAVILKLLASNQVEGTQSILTGKADCTTAEGELADLEMASSSSR